MSGRWRYPASKQLSFVNDLVSKHCDSKQAAPTYYCTWKLNNLEILGFNFHELWLFDSHQDVISNIFMALPRPPNNQYTSHNQHSHSLKWNHLGNLETTLLLGWWVPWRVAQYCVVLHASLNSQAKALWKWPDTTQTQRGCNHKALDTGSKISNGWLVETHRLIIRPILGVQPHWKTYLNPTTPSKQKNIWQLEPNDMANSSTSKPQVMP